MAALSARYRSGNLSVFCRLDNTDTAARAPVCRFMQASSSRQIGRRPVLPDRLLCLVGHHLAISPQEIASAVLPGQLA
jgi:hypothetical protein